MNVTVVDASAIAAVIFGEPDGDVVWRQLEGRHLIAPALLPFELAQVCTTKRQRHPDLGESVLDQYVSALSEIPIEFVPVDFETLPRLATRFRLSAYDAVYLWLALAHQAPLVSLDRKLVAAHRDAGIAGTAGSSS